MRERDSPQQAARSYHCEVVALNHQSCLPRYSASDCAAVRSVQCAAVTSGNRSSDGPVSLGIAYCLMATLVYSTMAALGEMATLFRSPARLRIMRVGLWMRVWVL
jgi:hypothetical protein